VVVERQGRNEGPVNRRGPRRTKGSYRKTIRFARLHRYAPVGERPRGDHHLDGPLAAAGRSPAASSSTSRRSALPWIRTA